MRMGNDPAYLIFTVSCKQVDQPAWSRSQLQQCSVAKILSDVWKAYQPFRGGRPTFPRASCWLESSVMLGRQVLVLKWLTAWFAQPQGTALGAFVSSQSASRNPQSAEWSWQGPGGGKEKTFDLRLHLLQTKGWRVWLWRPQENILICLI